MKPVSLNLFLEGLFLENDTYLLDKRFIGRDSREEFTWIGVVYLQIIKTFAQFNYLRTQFPIPR